MSAVRRTPNLREIELASPPAAVIDVRAGTPLETREGILAALDAGAPAILYDSRRVLPAVEVAHRKGALAVTVGARWNSPSIFADLGAALRYAFAKAVPA